MTEPNKGKRVRLNPESRWYNPNNPDTGGNPPNCRGTITENISTFGYPIRVEWDNGSVNGYHPRDLLPAEVIVLDITLDEVPA